VPRRAGPWARDDEARTPSQGQTRARPQLGRLGAAGGMTSGSRPSAAAHGEREAGRAGAKARLGCGAGVREVGLRLELGQKGKGVEGEVEKVFQFLKYSN
jgi:hypothetical protein